MAAPAVVEELFAPDERVATHPAVRTAARLAADVLAPHAAAADDPARGVDPAHLRLLAEHGMFAVAVPVDEGGLGADPRTEAETLELLAGTCGATWFVLTQHRQPQAFARGPAGLPTDVVRHGPAAARYRPELATGRTRAGVAIAHLRRPGTPAVRAVPDGAGWRFSGAADWCTGWGLVDVLAIAAATADDRFVIALLPAAERPGLRAGRPQRLAVMGGTRTVGLTLDGLAVGPDDVLAVVDAPAWRTADAARTANVPPPLLGLLRRVLVELAALPDADDTAVALAERAARLRDEAYALLTGTPPHERVRERRTLRGELTELAVRAAHALVAARGGGALRLDRPEQRWAREAAFHMVAAQTADVRADQLAAFRR